MLRRTMLGLLGISLTAPALAGKLQTVRTARLHSSLRYLTFLPKQYGKVAGGVPLIVFLHGSGERGTDINKVKAWGPPAIADKDPAFPFMVVSPQLPDGEAWHALQLKGLIDEVLRKYQVDRNRVYLTGLSLGGYGAWDLATRYPCYFAAVAPICGGGITRMAGNMRHVPTWVFHGKRDDAVPESESAAMVEALKAAGGNVKYTALPEAGHIDAWVHAYGEAGLFDWFLQHRQAAC